jgi:hypothetical protein
LDFVSSQLFAVTPQPTYRFDFCREFLKDRRLIHDYGGVDFLIVWDVAKKHVPAMTSLVRSIIAENRESK